MKTRHNGNLAGCSQLGTWVIVPNWNLGGCSQLGTWVVPNWAEVFFYCDVSGEKGSVM